MRGPRIARVEARALVIPTEPPESDGTLEWTHTTMLVVEASAGGARGLGYSYAARAAAALVAEVLAPVVEGHDALAVGASYRAMGAALRNVGRPGLGAMALSAVDAALWDLAGRLLGAPVAVLRGLVREAAPAYGSGGFTSLTTAGLERQLAGWAGEGLSRVKMKVGRDAAADPARVEAARRAIGPDVELFVDANGGYAEKQALALAERFAASGVTWLEEPVSSDDLDGLARLRRRVPPAMEVAAGEYASGVDDAERMLAAGAVDVMQADATRCGGPSGFFAIDALCEARHVPLSAHCAPALHAQLGCAAGALRHVERFVDHARIEAMLLDGVPALVGGCLRPDLERPGLGLELKRRDAERFAA